MTKKVDHPFKSSNMPFPLKVFFSFTTLVFKVLGVVSPKLAGKLALHLFMKPPNAPSPQREDKIKKQAKLSHRNIGDRKIAVRVWDNGSANKDTPTILLSHGWAGRTSQFLEIIEPLVAAGYRVVGADTPAHGDSSGKYSNVLDATQVLSIIAKEYSPLEAIVAHSFGTGTTLLALDRFSVKSPKIVLIGAYARVSFIINLFSDVFDLSQSTRDAMQQAGTDKFGDAYGIEWDWENIAPIHTIKSYQGEVLFIHDEGDQEVPIDEVSELHKIKQNAKIMITSGLGHRRILRNKEVVTELMKFINDKKDITE